MDRVNQLNQVHLPLSFPEVLRYHLRVTLYWHSVYNRETPKTHVQVRTATQNVSYYYQSCIRFALRIVDHYLYNKIVNG